MRCLGVLSFLNHAMGCPGSPLEASYPSCGSVVKRQPGDFRCVFAFERPASPGWRYHGAFMAEDPLRWLFGLERFGVKLGLDAVRVLLTSLGNPQSSFPSILIR